MNIFRRIKTIALIFAVASLTASSIFAQNVDNKKTYYDGEKIVLDSSWKYADFSEIHSGNAVIHLSKNPERKNIIVGINAGHGTEGGTKIKTWCHPDKTPKVTGGSTAAGAVKATAVSSGMKFSDGTPEPVITLKEARIVRDLLLEKGYDVLMIRDADDVQLDNIARTVICNNVADCHIAIHWDGDGLNYDKGCFYLSVPDGIKYLESVAASWQESERLGECCINALAGQGCKIRGNGSVDTDLTQTSYSFIPSIDIELGNQKSDLSDEALSKLANGLVAGIEQFFNFKQKE